MKIRITFKHLPAGGKSMRGGKHLVVYNSMGSVWHPDNKRHEYWIPKWLWKRL